MLSHEKHLDILKGTVHALRPCTQAVIAQAKRKEEREAHKAIVREEKRMKKAEKKKKAAQKKNAAN